MPPAHILFSAFLCLLFGANAVAVKVGMTEIGVFTSAALRFSLAGIALFAWARISRRPLGVTAPQFRKLTVVACCFTVQLSCFYLGLSRTTASHGTLIANLLPFVVLILAHFFIPGDRITPNKVLGLALGFAGIAVLLSDSAGAADLRSGDLFVLAAVLVWGCNAVYMKTIISEFNAIQVTLYPMAMAVPVFLLGGWLFDGRMIGSPTPRVVVAVLYQAFVTASFGFVAWNSLLKRYGASTMHSFVFILPLAGVFAGVVLLDEPVTLGLGVAIACVVAGIVIVHRRPGSVPAMPASEAAAAPVVLADPSSPTDSQCRP